MPEPSSAAPGRPANCKTSPGPAVARRFIAILILHMVALLRARLAQSRQSRIFRQASDRLLKDIGVSRETVAPETENGFWRVPLPRS